MGVSVKRRAAEPGGGQSVDSLELDLLLDAIYRLYGYDFRGYARTSIRRRIADLLEAMVTAQERQAVA